MQIFQRASRASFIVALHPLIRLRLIVQFKRFSKDSASLHLRHLNLNKNSPKEKRLGTHVISFLNSPYTPTTSQKVVHVCIS